MILCIVVSFFYKFSTKYTHYLLCIYLTLFLQFPIVIVLVTSFTSSLHSFLDRILNRLPSGLHSTILVTDPLLCILVRYPIQNNVIQYNVICLSPERFSRSQLNRKDDAFLSFLVRPIYFRSSWIWRIFKNALSVSALLFYQDWFNQLKYSFRHFYFFNSALVISRNNIIIKRYS